MTTHRFDGTGLVQVVLNGTVLKCTFFLILFIFDHDLKVTCYFEVVHPPIHLLTSIKGSKDIDFDRVLHTPFLPYKSRVSVLHRRCLN